MFLPPCDPAGVGHRYPAIIGAGEFGHVYLLLGWVFWHGFTLSVTNHVQQIANFQDLVVISITKSQCSRPDDKIQAICLR